VPHPTDAPCTDAWRGRFCLCAILLIGAAIRLWRFETPSLWFDEALVAMAADLPVGAIFQRLMLSDIHPPAFHLLTKLMLQAGRGDAVLRLPSLLFGIGGIWMAWRAGRELVDERAGLCMAAVIAVLPWHVLLSRQLRPYAIIYFFCLAAFLYVCRTIRTGRARDAALAALALWPPLLLTYGSLLCAGGAGAALLCFPAGRGPRLRNLLVFALLCAVPVALDAPFLMAALSHEQGVVDSAGRAALALTCISKLGDLLFRENVAWARLGLAACSLAGLAALWRRDRALAAASLVWLAAPLAVLVAAGYGSYFNPWHLFFLLPVLTVWLGLALRTLPGAPAVAVLAAAACAGLYVTAGEPFYYRESSYSGTAKAQARTLAGGHAPGVLYVYPEGGVVSPINWYLDQFSAPNPLRAQRLTPEDATLRLCVPGRGEPCAALARTPTLELGPLPARQRITSRPEDILPKVRRLEGVACMPVLEEVTVAARAGEPGFMEFEFHNVDPAPQEITIHFGFSNRLPGNRFAALCRFDDEPWAASFESLGPDQRGHDKLTLHRDRPYARLTLRFELRRTGRDPSYTGEDIEAVRMLDFKVEANAKQ